MTATRTAPAASARPLALLGLTGLLALASAACSGASARSPLEMPFDGARAWQHMQAIVAFGERPAGSASLERLRKYLTAELERLGLAAVRETFTEKTPIGPLEFTNLYVDIPGRGGQEGRADSEAPLVILATHFDTKRGLEGEFIGANDGASGTAVLLELARCLSERERKTAVTYRLLFLDGEEAVRKKWSGKDNTYGSRHHVAELERSGELKNVKACVVLDMVGDKDLQLTHELYSDPRLIRIFFDAAIALDLRAHVAGTPREIRDDHKPFLAADIPAVDLIDFEYGPDNDYWHSAEDVLERCSAASLEIIGRIVLQALPALEGFAYGT